MDIRYTLRPTISRTNARFRGPTESEKYTNFVGEVAHDLKLLGSVIDRDEFIFNLSKGQTDFINNNMSGFYSGDSVPITSNIGTSAKIVKVLGPVFDSIDLSTWTRTTANVTKIDDSTFQIAPSGNTSTTAVGKTVSVVEGQVIKITAYFKEISGTSKSAGVGSIDVNQGTGSVLFADPNPNDYIIVEHYIECKQKETITINIFGKNGEAGSTGVVEVKYITIDYVEISDLKLQAMNTDIKRRINTLEDEINNILENL